ncbi:MAG: DUF3011 domain-containing protein [Betaproteobacteria bacterium]|nr:DUF3011 domain-containing protein [Betaproteobacteria bacterium]
MKRNLHRAVSQGLIATFTLSLASSVFADYTTRCGSDGGRYRTCRLSSPGYVTVERRISGAKCDQGRSWDFTRREIWVDHGCEADFRVETQDGGSDSSDDKKKAAAVVGLLAGVAILGALANNKDHVDDYKYRDENYQGPRHNSYVPGWMVGSFSGFNPNYGADITLTIERDGRVTANTQGRTMRGYINDEQLHVGGAVFSIDQTRDGFVTAQRGERSNEVRYRRIN